MGKVIQVKRQAWHVRVEIFRGGMWEGPEVGRRFAERTRTRGGWNAVKEDRGVHRARLEAFADDEKDLKVHPMAFGP